MPCIVLAWILNKKVIELIVCFLLLAFFQLEEYLPEFYNGGNWNDFTETEDATTSC